MNFSGSSWRRTCAIYGLSLIHILHGMLEGAGNCLGHAAQQAVVAAVHLSPALPGGKDVRLYLQCHFGEIVLLGQLQPVRHMADDDLGTLLIDVYKRQTIYSARPSPTAAGEVHRPPSVPSSFFGAYG